MTQACLACGGHDLSASRLGPGLLACAACGAVFALDTGLDRLRDLYDESYFDRYPGQDRGYEDERARAYEAQVRTRLLTRYAPRGRLLEIGAASGWFLRAAHDAGYAVSGIEPEPHAADAARASGLDTRVGFVEEVELEVAAWDVVCAWHVIEHLAEPCTQLARLRASLRASGRLLIEVPNVASDLARRMGSGWSCLDLEHHVSQLTPRAVEALLRRAGFAVEHLDTFPTEAYFPPRRYLAPRTLAWQAFVAVSERRLPRRPHPSRHELIRAVARPA